MFKIGIIGSDNSHAEAFSKLVNIPDPLTGEFRFPDFRVTAIFGLDKARTEEVAREGRIEFIAETPGQMMGRVDAVMVVFRHGDLHAEYALPFIEAGIPTWVDKPFSISNEDAKRMIDAAKRNNTLLAGGSTCKFIYDILMTRNEVKNESRIGSFKTAVMNFPATLDNEYGGIYFYGAHLVEMAMAAFGYDAVSVVASEKNGLVTAIVKYDRYQVTLNFIPGLYEYYAILYGEKGVIKREIDINDCYVKGFESFAEMLRSRKMPLSFETLYKPVALLNAIVKAYETGDEIYLDQEEGCQ